MVHNLIPAEYTETGYRRERAICDKASAYWTANADYAKNGWSSLSAEKAAHPDYAACDNEMRGRVEQWEILHNPPEKLCAYVGNAEPNGMGIDREYGRTFPLTVWVGQKIGYCTLASKWHVNSGIGSHMHQIYAWIRGADGVEREYTGRGFGPGMAVMLRETAKSKRNRVGKGV